MNKQQFEVIIKKTFPKVNVVFFQQVEIYKVFLQKYNDKINLTRIDSDDKIYGEYFYESVIPYKNIDFNKYQKILDIGSGSGIPGVVLKLMFPNIDLTIIESNEKKCRFLEELKNELNIEFTIFPKRAEKILLDHRDNFDLVTSRALAKLPIAIELSMPYTKVNGLTIIPKSQKIEQESKNIDSLINSLGSKLIKIDSFISDNHKTHNIFIIQKMQKSSHKYPRA
jgi:16S rRNA (guanine527-N7)-methyltransferase